MESRKQSLLWDQIVYCCSLQAEHERQLTLVFQQHTAQVVDLQRKTQLEESLRWRQHLAALEGQFRAAQGRADGLEEELRSARACIPWTPAAHEVLLCNASSLTCVLL